MPHINKGKEFKQYYVKVSYDGGGEQIKKINAIDKPHAIQQATTKLLRANTPFRKVQALSEVLPMTRQYNKYNTGYAWMHNREENSADDIDYTDWEPDEPVWEDVE